MGFAKVHAAQIIGLQSHIIDVEIDMAGGLPAFSIIGLGDRAVEEAKDRIGAALKNNGYPSPKHTNGKVVISLAPAHIPKNGTVFDLAMSIGYLRAAGVITGVTDRTLFLGELSLDGTLRPIRGTLPMAQEARQNGFHHIIVPSENAAEASLVNGIAVYGAQTINDVVHHLNGVETMKPEPASQLYHESDYSDAIDLRDIRGQEAAKRALEIAAAGEHNIALSGPPGTGKTLLARSLPTIMPKLTDDEVLEVTCIHSVAGTAKGVVAVPPFRAPHHTASYVSIVGGGTVPIPGEVTLAHRGVLFLDEFPEFERRVIETLRQPLEDRNISISRARGTACFPASFILVAALNPCPCGHYGSDRPCVCTPVRLEGYRKKVSGPIIDRIDLWVTVDRVDHEKLLASDQNASTPTSTEIRLRVERARAIQRKRYRGEQHIHTNAQLTVAGIQKHVQLRGAAHKTLKEAAEKLHLSGRSVHRTIKVARTIADLAGTHDVSEEHVLEALSYRPNTL